MRDDKVLDRLLLVLADAFEGHIPKRVFVFKRSASKDFGLIRECLGNCTAALIAEGSATDWCGGLRLTRQGYAKYKDRIARLRLSTSAS